MILAPAIDNKLASSILQFVPISHLHLQFRSPWESPNGARFPCPALLAVEQLEKPENPISCTYISLAVVKMARVARREGGPKPDVALDIAGPSAGTKAAAREEYADTARLELRE